MLILGLAGLQGVGKDVVANYLVQRYGFTKFAWSDALYAEVQQAFGLKDQSLLRDRATKEEPQTALMLTHCIDPDFASIAAKHVHDLLNYDGNPFAVPISPRRILQWWGTYRRGPDEDYWVLKAAERIADYRTRGLPEHRPNFFVEAGTRFENERGWIKRHGGNIWHIERAGIKDTTGHVSAQRLPVLDGERVLHNNDTIDRLHWGVDLLLKTNYPVVRVEPMLTPEELGREYAAALSNTKTGVDHEAV